MDAAVDRLEVKIIQASGLKLVESGPPSSYAEVSIFASIRLQFLWIKHDWRTRLSTDCGSLPELYRSTIHSWKGGTHQIVPMNDNTDRRFFMCRIWGCNFSNKEWHDIYVCHILTYRIILYYTTQCRNVKCRVMVCIVLYCIVLYCIVFYWIVLVLIVPFTITWYDVVSYSTALHCIVLSLTALSVDK